MSGMSPWAMLGSARRDRSVVEQKLSRETVRRVVGFALPHRALIAGFLVFVVLDSLLVVVNPLLVKHLLDDGILGKNTTLVIWLAVAMAATSVLDALLGVG
jgi:ATP-binding cassette subfamily B protein